MNIVPENKAGIMSDIKSKPLFHWAEISNYLSQEVFEVLNESYPHIDMFEKHTGIERIYSQRPHDRYYLAYDNSIYSGDNQGKGIIKHDELSGIWKEFVVEILQNDEYHAFIREALEVENFEIRLAWHMAFNNCEVSPHLDAPEKYGTHIFYFNTDKDWKKEWGGETVLMEGKSVNSMNPEFTEFKRQSAVSSIINNKSFIFQNSDVSWHGVKKINCPDGNFRRIFTVVFEKKGARAKTRKQPSRAKKIIKKISKIWK